MQGFLINACTCDGDTVDAWVRFKWHSPQYLATHTTGSFPILFIRLIFFGRCFHLVVILLVNKSYKLTRKDNQMLIKGNDKGKTMLLNGHHQIVANLSHQPKTTNWRSMESLRFRLREGEKSHTKDAHQLN